jgi:hypothetical protein
MASVCGIALHPQTLSDETGQGGVQHAHLIPLDLRALHL